MGRGDKLHELLSRRRPFLTAKRLLTNQVFRDLYGTDTIDVDQRLKITSLTFLFTDLKGSTELYERVGDLVAFDLVRAHFRVLNDIVAGEAGAVVKTSGDAVMATFPTPDRAVAAALRMREAMRDFKDARAGEGLLLKIGIHEGPCLAVVLDNRQDYFGRPSISRRACRAWQTRARSWRPGRSSNIRGLRLARNQRAGAGPAAARAARHRRRDGGLRNSLITWSSRCLDERSQKSVSGSAAIGRSRAVAAIEELVGHAPDRALCRVNVLDFAAKRGLDEERAIAAFLHAARAGIFELSWNVLCPSCGGVLDDQHDVEERQQRGVRLRLCAAGYAPTLDEMVEVTFTVSRRVRRIAAHDPTRASVRRVFSPDLLGLGDRCSG